MSCCAPISGYFNQGMGTPARRYAQTHGGHRRRVINVGNKFDSPRGLRSDCGGTAASTASASRLRMPLDGTYRKLEIKNKQNYKIRAGYYAGRKDD